MEYQNVTIFLFTSFKVIIFCQLYETKFNFDAMKPNTALYTAVCHRFKNSELNVCIIM